MKTLAQFKSELNVTALSFIVSKEKKRTFTTIKDPSINQDITLLVSKEFNAEKPAFVVPTTNQETGEMYKNCFTIVNSDKVEASSLVL